MKMSLSLSPCKAAALCPAVPTLAWQPTQQRYTTGTIRCRADSEAVRLSVGRRNTVKSLLGGLALLGFVLPCSPSAAEDEVVNPTAPKNDLIERLLERSRANKAKYDKERLDSYYKRNFKEYFEFVEGTLRNKEELTEAEKGIVDWLKRNR